jgi:hypothetical protein
MAIGLERRIITASMAAPPPPCVVLSCTHYEKCKAEEKACKIFQVYMSQGDKWRGSYDSQLRVVRYAFAYLKGRFDRKAVDIAKIKDGEVVGYTPVPSRQIYDKVFGIKTCQICLSRCWDGVKRSRWELVKVIKNRKSIILCSPCAKDHKDRLKQDARYLARERADFEVVKKRKRSKLYNDAVNLEIGEYVVAKSRSQGQNISSLLRTNDMRGKTKTLPSGEVQVRRVE